TPVASLHEAQPLFAERFEQEIGSLLPGRRSNEDTLYGFDALERLVLARTHDGTGDPDTETFRERAGETVRTVTFE
ncbi:hypothetical protein OFC08_35615, partial [Escherichia coli]|nr:hypothetical protein [Escherichia coli]